MFQLAPLMTQCINTSCGADKMYLYVSSQKWVISF